MSDNTLKMLIFLLVTSILLNGVVALYGEECNINTDCIDESTRYTYVNDNNFKCSFSRCICDYTRGGLVYTNNNMKPTCSLFSPTSGSAKCMSVMLMKLFSSNRENETCIENGHCNEDEVCICDEGYIPYGEQCVYGDVQRPGDWCGVGKNSKYKYCSVKNHSYCDKNLCVCYKNYYLNKTTNACILKSTYVADNKLTEYKVKPEEYCVKPEDCITGLVCYRNIHVCLCPSECSYKKEDEVCDCGDSINELSGTFIGAGVIGCSISIIFWSCLITKNLKQLAVKKRNFVQLPMNSTASDSPQHRSSPVLIPSPRPTPTSRTEPPAYSVSSPAPCTDPPPYDDPPPPYPGLEHNPYMSYSKLPYHIINKTNDPQNNFYPSCPPLYSSIGTVNDHISQAPAYSNSHEPSHSPLPYSLNPFEIPPTGVPPTYIDGPGPELTRESNNGLPQNVYNTNNKLQIDKTNVINPEDKSFSNTSAVGGVPLNAFGGVRLNAVGGVPLTAAVGDTNDGSSLPYPLPNIGQPYQPFTGIELPELPVAVGSQMSYPISMGTLSNITSTTALTTTTTTTTTTTGNDTTLPYPLSMTAPTPEPGSTNADNASISYSLSTSDNTIGINPFSPVCSPLEDLNPAFNPYYLDVGKEK